MEGYYTAKEAAAVLGVVPQRIHALVRGGRLPATKVGNAILIRRVDLARLKLGKPGRPKLVKREK